jgi:cytochrome c
MPSCVPVGVASVCLMLLYATAPATAAEDGGDAKSGELAFNNNCRTCHSTKPGDNRLGPSLAHVVGAKSGSQPGYANYSQAMKTAGITWDEQTLDRFITNPETVVPNNNMKPFKGVPDPAVRKAIIAHLKSGSG